jgi:hypothetical protein
VFRRSLRFFFVWAGLLVLDLTLDRPSAAEDAEALAVAVTYSVPPGCPDVSAFKREISHRTQRFAEDSSGSPSFVLVVSVEARDTDFGGTLDVVDPSGEHSTRSLVGNTCAEVTDALAFMAALAIDPMALSGGQPMQPTPPSAPVGAPSAAPSESASQPPPASPGAGQPALVVPRERSGASRPWEFGLGGGIDISSGVTPDVLFGPRGFLEATSPFSGIVGVSLRLGFERATRSNIESTSGAASFTWTFGTVDACPLRWTSGPFALLPCVRLEAGELVGTGDVTNGLTAKQGWLAIDALGRARWTPIRHLSVELEGGGRVPTIRHTFEFTTPAGSPINPSVYVPAVFSAVFDADVRLFF